MNFSRSSNSIKEILSNWRYALIAIFSAVLFYLLNVLAFEFLTLNYISSNTSLLAHLKIFFLLALHFASVMNIYAFISLILISLLFGIFVSLLTYKVVLNLQTRNRKVSWFGWFGAFLAFLIPGCTICGVGLLSSLGVGAGILSFLPGHGLEISVLAIAILLFTVLKLSEGMYACEITGFKKSKVNSKVKLKGGF